MRKPKSVRPQVTCLGTVQRTIKKDGKWFGFAVAQVKGLPDIPDGRVEFYFNPEQRGKAVATANSIVRLEKGSADDAIEPPQQGAKIRFLPRRHRGTNVNPFMLHWVLEDECLVEAAKLLPQHQSAERSLVQARPRELVTA